MPEGRGNESKWALEKKGLSLTRGLKLRGGGKKGPTARKCLQPKQGLVFQPPPPPRSASTTNHLHSFSLSLSLAPLLFTFLHHPPFLPPLSLCSLKYHFAPSRCHYGKIKAEHVLPSAIICCRLTVHVEVFFFFLWVTGTQCITSRVNTLQTSQGIYIHEDQDVTDKSPLSPSSVCQPSSVSPSLITPHLLAHLLLFSLPSLSPPDKVSSQTWRRCINVNKSNWSHRGWATGRRILIFSFGGRGVCMRRERLKLFSPFLSFYIQLVACRTWRTEPVLIENKYCS